MDKAGIANRLSKLGLRNVAEAYKEEVRQRYRTEGKEKDLAAAAAWREMWDMFRPICERIEQQQTQDAGDGEATLQGCADDLTPYLDPNYTEADAGRWLRDGLVWTAAEIRRVVIDGDDGTTTVDLARAATPPPTAWAVFCLESFARKSPDKRGELIGRVLPFAQRGHDVPEGVEDEQQAGFLDTIR